jgi:hypothetical protein
MDLPDAFFSVDGDRVIPTELARGPWDAGSAHGGPVAAVIGRAVERFQPDPDLGVVRLTLEILRPVPLQELRFEATMLRGGKRVQLVGIEVRHEGTVVTRATALRVRRPPEAGDLPTELHQPDDRLRPPGNGMRQHREGRFGIGILDGMELRAVDGGFFQPGPSTIWFRMLRPLVEGEETTSLQRLLVAADFGNGIGGVLDFEQHLFINPDLTVYLHRLPEGEWVGLSATMWLAPEQGAYAESDLYDEHGRIGRAVQGLYVATR